LTTSMTSETTGITSRPWKIGISKLPPHPPVHPSGGEWPDHRRMSEVRTETRSSWKPFKIQIMRTMNATKHGPAATSIRGLLISMRLFAHSRRSKYDR
jgi:hypothetical protein